MILLAAFTASLREKPRAEPVARGEGSARRYGCSRWSRRCSSRRRRGRSPTAGVLLAAAFAVLLRPRPDGPAAAWPAPWTMDR
ncbi:hypothetical protein [Amycolatopsis sp. lyj-346]|uniref:hypothetical protein n=1 Tax=Amycolatopsis sp. lyj-346 TaxID=2789289 RepID=UPI003978DAC3